MKRSPALLKLSREHHTALSLALRIEKAADPAAQNAVQAMLPGLFRSELEPHFQEEENSLLPRLSLAGENGLVDRTLQEHAVLRALVERIADADLSALPTFAKLLREHVRFEERDLFMIAQRVLPADYLDSGSPPPAAPTCSTTKK